METAHFVWPRWMSHLLNSAQHGGYQGELEMISFVFVVTLLLGAFSLAAIVFVHLV